MKQEQNLKPYDEGNYHIEVKPWNCDNWRNTDKVQVVMTLKVGNENRIFKGLIDMTGIIKGGD
jgi:hypothetical protein